MICERTATVQAEAPAKRGPGAGRLAAGGGYLQAPEARIPKDAGRRASKGTGTVPDGDRIADLLRRERLARNIESLQARAPVFEQHDRIRDAARREYQHEVNRIVDALAVEALARQKRQNESAEERRKREDDLLAALALLLLLAGTRIYRATRSKLGRLLGFAPPTGGVPGATAGAPHPTAEATAFSEERAGLLRDFPRTQLERLARAAEEARARGSNDQEVDQAIEDEATAIKTGAGKVLADTESQATYGDAQRRLLTQAGFITKVWTTMEDDRVRPSHVLCGNQGEVPMDKPFANGLQYPGDPHGGPEETVNCRCWLTGGRRGPRPDQIPATEPLSLMGLPIIRASATTP